MDNELRAAVREYLAAVDEYEGTLKFAPQSWVRPDAIECNGKCGDGDCCADKAEFATEDPRFTYARKRIETARDRMREALSAATAAERMVA
jgi:hypothetical protein